jgi:hypothetical protein
MTAMGHLAHPFFVAIFQLKIFLQSVPLLLQKFLADGIPLAKKHDVGQGLLIKS